MTARCARPPPWRRAGSRDCPCAAGRCRRPVPSPTRGSSCRAARSSTGAARIPAGAPRRCARPGARTTAPRRVAATSPPGTRDPRRSRLRHRAWVPATTARSPGRRSRAAHTRRRRSRCATAGSPQPQPPDPGPDRARRTAPASARGRTSAPADAWPRGSSACHWARAGGEMRPLGPRGSGWRCDRRRRSRAPMSRAGGRLLRVRRPATVRRRHAPTRADSRNGRRRSCGRRSAGWRDRSRDGP